MNHSSAIQASVSSLVGVAAGLNADSIITGIIIGVSVWLITYTGSLILNKFFKK